MILSQTIAVTEKGDSVVLYNNGTWEYLTEYSDLTDSSVIVPDTNKTDFYRPLNSKRLLKGQRTNYELWYNSDIWHLKENNLSSIEYELTDNNEEMICIVIPERITVSIDALKQLAITNGKNASTKFRILKEEVRKVNNKYVYMLKFSATVKGINFIYIGYYVAGETNCIQLLTMTPENLFSEHKEELENILNGLIY